MERRDFLKGLAAAGMLASVAASQYLTFRHRTAGNEDQRV